jgi:hypothetical protein
MDRSKKRGDRQSKYAEPFFKRCTVAEIERLCPNRAAFNYDEVVKSEGIESQRARFDKLCAERAR